MHDAFISYSRKDTGFARLLEKALEAYRPPKDLSVAQRHLAIFRDEGDLTGVEYFASIERSLSDSTRLIVICSPHARSSTYVNDEIERFVKLRGADNVVPILLSGIPNNEARTPDDAEQAFPAALCQALAMPLAVPYRGFDMRKDRIDRGSFADAWYLLLANLYGVSRAELEQREGRRRTRRLRIIAGIVTGVIGALAAALVVSIVFWRRAVEQKNIAVEQSQIALSRQLSANSAQYGTADPRLAALLAVEAYATETTPEARRALYGAMQLVVPFTLLKSKQALEATAFSPDGTLLAAAGKDSLIHIWDVRSHRPVGEPWQAHTAGSNRTAAVNGIAFSPDGATLASVGDDGTLILWDVRSGKPIVEPLRVSSLGGVYSVAFSPDGKVIATGSIEKVVVLWDAVQHTMIRKLEGHDFAVNALAFDPTGTQLAAASGSSVLLWNLATGQPMQPPLKGHTNLVWSLAFSPRGDQLASGSGDYTIRLWSVASGEPDGEPLIAHKNWVKTLTYSSDGRVLISGSNDQTIRFWDLQWHAQIGAPLEGHSLWVNSIALDRGGNLLASAGGDGALILWSLARDGVRFTVNPLGVDSQRDHTISRNGRFVALSEYGQGVQLWDVDQGKVVLQATHVDLSSSIMALSNDGRLQVTKSSAGLALSDLRLDKIHCTIPGAFVNENGEGAVAAFSPDGALVAASVGTDSYGLWRTADCAQLKLPAVKHDRTVWQLAFTPDSRQVVSGSFTTSLHVQDVASGVDRIVKATSDIGTFAISRDSRTIALSTAERIELYDLQSGGVAGAPLVGQKGAVRELGMRELTFSADAKILASGGDSGNITLWDLSTARPLGPPINPAQGQLRHLTFSADGKRLLTSGTDGPIKSLDMDADSWMRQVCRVVQSDLSAEEWRRFVGAGTQVPRCLTP